jgi:receptor protein-tyrosine kinase
LSTGDVYRALWRHKYFIVILTAALVAAAWYFAKQQTPEYEASTLVRVQGRVADPADAVGSLVLGERLAQTYANIVETREFDNRVEAQVAGRTGSTVAFDLSAEPVEDLELLWINARSSSPGTAAAAANAAPIALRGFIQETGTLREQIVTVEPAERPTDPVSPNMVLIVTLAVMLGLVLNAGLALLIELLSDRLPDAERLEETTGKPILAHIPVLDFPRSVARTPEQRSDTAATMNDPRAVRGTIGG